MKRQAVMSNRFARRFSDGLVNIEETSAEMVIGDRETNPRFFILPVLLALALLLLFVVLAVGMDLWFLPIFIFIVLAFSLPYFMRLLALPRFIVLDKEKKTMVVEKRAFLRKRRFTYTLSQIQEIRCRYISKGTEIILSIAMTDGEEVKFFEDITVRGLGTYGVVRLPVTHHEIPLRIARFLGVPYRKIFWGSANADMKDGNVEIIYPTDKPH
jgi:hypothetical protein